MDDKDVPISICKFFGSFNAFGGGHEPIHLNEDSWLKTIEIPFLESSSSVQLHFGYFSIVLLDKLIVEYFDRVVGLIKRQYARLKLFGRFKSPQHGIQNLVVERFPDIELDNLLCLLFGLDELQMFELGVLDYVPLFFLNCVVLLSNQGHEIAIGDLLIFMVDLY